MPGKNTAAVGASGAGCGLFKRSDATSAVTGKFARSLANLVPPLTTLSRESNTVLYSRLSALFPGASDTPLHYNSVTNQAWLKMLPAQVLDPQQSSNLFTALVGEDRPDSSVAQMAWRALAESVCEWESGLAKPRLYSGGTQYSGMIGVTDPTPAQLSAPGAIFSDADVLMDGETLPDKTKDYATYLAFVVARNAWLFPYAADSPEVRELAKLFADTPSLVLPELQADWGKPYLKMSDPSIDTINVPLSTLTDVLPDKYAHVALCVAALTAPQFLIGNLGKDDVVRRVALDLLGRRPTFKEISDYHNGTLDLNAWIAKFQQTDAYLKIVDDWHRDILGLRPFLPGYAPDPSNRLPPGNWTGKVADLRPFYWAAPNSSAIKVRDYELLPGPYTSSGSYVGTTDPKSGNAFWMLAPHLDYYSYGYLDSPKSPYLAGTKSLLTDYGPQGQPFDPRTAVLAWETKTSATSPWTPRLAWVLKSLKDSNPTLLAASYPGIATLDHCIIDDPSKKPQFPAPLASFVGTHGGADEFPTYYLCTTTGDTFTAAHLADFPGNDISDQYCMAGGTGFCAASHYPAKRFRRIAPSTVTVSGNTVLAEQDGLSAMQSWYSGQTVYVSNSLHRFLFACYFRPLPYTQSVVWSWASDYWMPTPVDYFVQDGSWAMLDTYVNPYLLNQFRCGIPDPSKLDALNGAYGEAAAAAAEELAYPFGYDHKPAHYGDTANTPLSSALNPVLTLGSLLDVPSSIEDAGTVPQVSSKNEGGAIIRLHHQMENEPIHLLNYILTNHRPYTELVTASYTLGGPELELLYRTQGYQLPRFPDGADFNALRSASLAAQYWPNPAGKENPKIIDLTQFNSLPNSYLVGPVTPTLQELPAGYDPATPWPNPAVPATVATTLNTWNQSYAPQQPIDSHLSIPPRVGAGILTMPAFLGPVATRARTISSRFFLRFLCGPPNVVQLTQAQQSLHAAYMASPGNPKANATAAEHISRQECRECHLNLDPLAQALFPNFLNFVQVDENLAVSGSQFITYAGGLGGTQFVGIHPGPWQGTGAFLGQQVSGPAQVGQVLAQNAQYHNCVVRQAFQHLFGREAGLPDAPLVLKATLDFEASGFDYNALVRELVTSPNFLRED